MRTKRDLLYTIFEQHLLNSLVAESTEEALIARVVSDYLSTLKTQGFIPVKFAKILEDDLKDEVLEMYRKKTYGHPKLESYKKAAQKLKSLPKVKDPAAASFKKTAPGSSRSSRRQKVN